MVHGPITKDVSTRALGLVDIRVGNAADNIANIAPVLGAANSIGALKETSFNSSKEFFEQYSGFPKSLDGVVPLSSLSKLVGSYLEITPFNMALSQGLDPSASAAASVTKDVATNSTAGTTADLAITVGGTPISEEWTVVFTGPGAGSIFGKKTGHVHDFVDLSSAMDPAGGYFSIPANFFTGTWSADDTYVFYTTAGGTGTYTDTHSGSIGLGSLSAPAAIRVEGVYTFPNGINTMTMIFPLGKATGDLDLAFSESDEAAPQITLSSTYAGSRNVNGDVVWDSMPQGQIVWG